MRQIKVTVAAMLLCVLGMSAAAARGGLTFQFRDETAPAGGTVQMKLEDSDGSPISGGRPAFAYDESVFDAVSGIGVFASTGETAGAAVIDGNHVGFSYVTTTPLVGDHPIMTVALRIRPGTARGTRTEFTLDSSSRWTVAGEVVRPRVSSGEVTVGGRAAISNVVPGDGWFPAGTVVSVQGVGFNSRSRLRVEDISVNNVRLVSPTEMRFTLSKAANLTAARLRLDNPDSPRVTYYTYMRGVPAATSQWPLLSTTLPFFSGTRRSLATVGPIPALNTVQYAAVALQNPGLTIASVTMELLASDGTRIDASTRSLDKGYRLALEVSELFGMAPPPGASVRVISSVPIHVFGLLCDEGAWTVTPWLAAEASESDAADDSRE